MVSFLTFIFMILIRRISNMIIGFFIGAITSGFLGAIATDKILLHAFHTMDYSAGGQEYVGGMWMLGVSAAIILSALCGGIGGIIAAYYTRSKTINK